MLEAEEVTGGKEVEEEKAGGRREGGGRERGGRTAVSRSFRIE